MTKEKKTKLLKKFIETTSGYFVGADLEFYNLVVGEVKQSGRNTTAQRAWTHSYMGEKLTVLYLLYDNFVAKTTNNDESRRATRGCTGVFLKGFHFQIKDVLVQVEAEEAVKAAKATRTSLNLQKAGTRVQDRIAFDAKKVGLEPCPVCNHMCTMAVQTHREIDTINGQALQDHNRKLETWEQLPPNQRVTPKPRAPTTTSEQVACYCIKNHCLNALDGGQCYHCKDFATECATTDAPGFLQEDASGNLTCPCAICACSCQVMFKQHDRRKIALIQAQQTAGLPSIEEQSTVGFFHGVLDSHLQNGSISARQESNISQEQVRNDAASFASLGLLADPNIQSNTLLRKNLQAACGPRPRITKEGVPIDVLRRNQGSLASRAASQATVFYPGVQTPPPPEIIMPPPPHLNAVASRNSRFYCNKLKGTPVERAAQLSNKKRPPVHQVLPLPTKQSARNTVDLMSPVLPAPTIDIMDDDTSIASMESLSLEEKVRARKT